MRTVLVLALLPLLAAACSTADTSDDTTAGTNGGSGSAPVTNLTITVTEAPGVEPVVYTLTCDPAGGDHPDPAAACTAIEEALSAALNPLEPVPADMACTEIYGGDQTALIEGTVVGTPVTAELSRINGCEIARWDALQPVVVVAGGA